MKISILKQRPVMMTLALSFVVIFLIPLVFGVVYYFKVEDSLKENVYTYNTVIVEQIRSVIDDYLKSTDLISYQISQDKKLQEMIDNESLAKQSKLDFVDVSNNLKQYKSMNNYIYDIFICLIKQNEIITTNMKKDSKTYFEDDCNYIDFTYKNRFDLVLDQYNYKTFMRSTQLKNLPYSQNVITYIQSLPISDIQNVRSQLVIQLNSDKIMEVIKNVGIGNEGKIFVVDKKGQVILSNDNDNGIIDDAYEKLYAQSGMFEYKIGKEKNMVLYTASKQSDWTYIMIIPQEAYLKRIINIKWIAITLLIIYFIIGSYIMYLCIRKNYKPIKSIINEIQQIREIPYNIRSNEFEFIKHEMITSCNNENNLKEILKKQEDVLNSNYLIKIIQGKVDIDEKAIDTLKSLNMDLRSEYFFVLAVKIENCNKFIQNDSEREWSLVRFVVANILYELSNEKNSGYVVELDRSKLVLLMCSKPERIAMCNQDITCIANKLTTVLKEEFDIDISIGIGDMHSGISNIKESYTEALTSLNYKFVSEGKHIVAYSELISNNKLFSDCCYYYPAEIENKIINYVNNGDFESVSMALDDVFDTNLKFFNMSIELKLCLFYDILGTLVKTLNTISADCELSVPKVILPLNFQEFSTLECLIAAIKEQYKHLCDYINKNKSNYSENIIENIKAYIYQHYMDYELSLNSIAEKFEITPQYLSVFFKKNEKTKLVDYIADIRINQAKVLLRDKSLTVLQVANMVGYSNDIVFIRFFKRHEGVTPGQFRGNS